MADLPAGIHLLTDEGWDDLRRCVAGEIDYAEPHDDWCWDADCCRAYLEAAAALWAGLSSRQRSALLGTNDYGMPTWQTCQSLHRAGLVTDPRGSGQSYWTPLGRAVAHAGGAE